MAGLILGPVGVDHILRALRWIEGGPGDPSFLLGALLIAAAITPFAIGVAAGAYARRRGRPWEQAVKTGAVTAFLTGVVAFIAAMPIAVVFA
ncbi:hypothetical protein [Streptomyces albipurpureus]|uniref:Uncharacterized protein n=1 Tax=Streptomyces albipurpureus TaxID=2897419 RepID=A0ABT0UJB9_9ACTN|nr:hypothetical protein [Streptomyces sp. CWNU-1]MCM2387518.1 hypothetical protein [Streptomyces sp. CWNU-1]